MSKSNENYLQGSDFVLDKFIFVNVFEKDIRRVYLYRKTERLTKAIQLIVPAFAAAPSLRNRLDAIAVGLIDAAIAPPLESKEMLSRELLALSTILSVARTGGLLSQMNADLIVRETHLLLQEVASYEEPRLALEDAPTLAELSRSSSNLREPGRSIPIAPATRAHGQAPKEVSNKGQIKDKPPAYQGQNSRQEAILGILQTKGPSNIKDISTVIRSVSEKTIQRELQTLAANGTIQRSGERRWTTYSIKAFS